MAGSLVKDEVERVSVYWIVSGMRFFFLIGVAMCSLISAVLSVGGRPAPGVASREAAVPSHWLYHLLMVVSTFSSFDSEVLCESFEPVTTAVAFVLCEDVLLELDWVVVHWLLRQK